MKIANQYVTMTLTEVADAIIDASRVRRTISVARWGVIPKGICAASTRVQRYDETAE